MKPTPSNQVVPVSATGYDTEMLRRNSSKVLIQDAATRRYLTVSGAWSSQPEEALPFRSGSSAIAHANQHRLQHVNLVLSRAITAYEVIPIKIQPIH